MKRKAVFVDVDGTLVNDRGLVPDSARAAVRQARAHGHLVFLSTGRSVGELWPSILEVGFDGVIAAAGGYVEIDGQVLAHHLMSAEQVRRVVDLFDAHGVEYFLESNTGLYGSPRLRDRLEDLIFGGVTDHEVLTELNAGFGQFLTSLVVDPANRPAEVNKISFLHSELTVDQIRRELADDFVVIPATVSFFGRNSGEVSLPGIHKAEGIRLVLQHVGIDVEDTVAFGDGHNDLEMLEYVGVGIAMGNAVEPLKRVADDVTGTPDEHGLRTALARYGLLEPLVLAS